MSDDVGGASPEADADPADRAADADDPVALREDLDPETAEAIREVTDLVEAADSTVALTGAGVSAPSGVSTFRGDDGVWEGAFDQADFRLGRFEANPAGFWRDRVELHDVMYPDEGSVEPNAAHEALADLEASGHLDAVLTQNTDGLHQAAGSDRVVELHGNHTRVACRRCGRRADAAPVRERVRQAVAEGDQEGENPPTCPECGGFLKPDVVLFGERLSADRLSEARDLASGADVLLAVGTSLTVDPAASLAREAGDLVVVTLEETRFDRLAAIALRADATRVLPALEALIAD